MTRVAERRWRGRGELIRARAEYGVRRREEDLLPARETRSKSSAAARCGCGGACVRRARCGVAADVAQLKFLRLSILAPKSAAGAAALRISREQRDGDVRSPRGGRCMFAESRAGDAARHKERYRGLSSRLAKHQSKSDLQAAVSSLNSLPSIVSALSLRWCGEIVVAAPPGPPPRSHEKDQKNTTTRLLPAPTTDPIQQPPHLLHERRRAGRLARLEEPQDHPELLPRALLVVQQRQRPAEGSSRRQR